METSNGISHMAFGNLKEILALYGTTVVGSVCFREEQSRILIRHLAILGPFRRLGIGKLGVELV